MTGNLLDLIVIALAVWQIVEVWHHGEIFASARSRLETIQPGEAGFWPAALFLCPFCLSVWVAACIVPLTLMGGGYATPAWVFAASRAANLLNDLTKFLRRTVDHVTDPDRNDRDAYREPGERYAVDLELKRKWDEILLHGPDAVDVRHGGDDGAAAGGPPGDNPTP